MDAEKPPGTGDLDAATRVARCQDVIAERLLDETVILDPDSGRYARLNPSGRWIWERLARPESVGALAEAMAAEFGIPESRALADVLEFVRALRDRGLVELAG